MTCDRVRELLPEHVLGTLEEPDDLAVRRHLRGCAGCRAESSALADGLAAFAVAAHDRPPPPHLQDAVRTVLEEEWRDAPTIPTRPRRRGLRWLAAAAAVAVVASIGFGLAQMRRASVASEGAQSYERLLEVLGGKEFRVGELEAVGSRPLEGSIVVYDSHDERSWVVVFLKTSGVTGEAIATLSARDGRTIDTWPIQIDRDGQGAGWFVTSVELTGFDRVEIKGPDGAPLATASITPA
jgi:hypothetical protein